MKICLINNLYKPFNRGGAEKVTETIANGLIKSGHEVFVISSRPRRGKSQISNVQPAGGMQIYYLDSLYYNLNKLPKFLRFFWQVWNIFNFVNYFKIKKILIKEKAEAVISNNLMGLGFLTPLAIRRLKIKHLHIAHDIQLIHPVGLLRFGRENLINSFFARNYAGLTSEIFSSPKAVIFPSRWLMNLYLDKIFFIKSKRIVLPNPLVKALTAPATRNNNVFTFLYLGQVEEYKGVNLLIQAFKKVKEKYDRAELVIAGTGANLENLKNIAGEDKSVKFLGWPGDEIADKLLLSSDCLIYPSLVYENCPHAIQKAFGAGLPVIAADLGGISELVSEDGGILFRPGNPVDLVEKMLWAIDHKSELAEIAKAGLVKAASYNVENYIKELQSLINQ